MKKIRVHWHQLRVYLRRHPRMGYFYVGAGIILFGALAVIIVSQLTPVRQLIAPVTTKKAAPKTYESPLTGAKLTDEAPTKRPVTAIMIENSTDARPQSGLKDAGIVYEAIAEGGITRLLAVYQEARPQTIGPVRSLRPYYADWGAGYDASIVHVGGSRDALTHLREISRKDLDQYAHGDSFWRTNDRVPPHNVYTSFDKLDALNSSLGFTSSTFTGFARNDDKPAEAPEASAIAINFSSASYNTTYRYDKENDHYTRSVGGEPHNDREAGQLTPRSVVAIKIAMSTYFDDGPRMVATTIGSGEATVFQHGKVTEGTWRKSSPTAPLELLDSAGKTISLPRGQTWIAAIPSSGQGSVSW